MLVCAMQWYMDLVDQINKDKYSKTRVIWDILNEPDSKVRLHLQSCGMALGRVRMHLQKAGRLAQLQLTSCHAQPWTLAFAPSGMSGMPSWPCVCRVCGGRLPTATHP